MFNNYLKIALRTMLRNKSYSIINILGLSIGVACCLLLALYIQDERSYDQHHQRLSTIYRITTHFHTENGLDDLATTSPPIAMAMQEEIPEVEVAARLLNPPGVSQNLIRYGDNTFYERDGFLADSTLFDILTFNFIEGNPKKASSVWHDAIEIAQRTRDTVVHFKAEFQLFKLSIEQGNLTAANAFGRRLNRMAPWISRSEPEIDEFLRLYAIHRKPKQRGVARPQP